MNSVSIVSDKPQPPADKSTNSDVILRNLAEEMVWLEEEHRLYAREAVAQALFRLHRVRMHYTSPLGRRVQAPDLAN